jgi:hypothetical protein
MFTRSLPISAATFAAAIVSIAGTATVASLAPAHAQEVSDLPEQCAAGSNRISPYPTIVADGFEHDRFKTRPIDRAQSFGGFFASFDGPDDDDRDGIDDFRGTPEWVAYEMKELRDEDDEFSPTPQAQPPENWYELPALRYVEEQAEVTIEESLGLRPIGDAYEGHEAVWVRGHLAPPAHAARIGWRQACNAHVFANTVPQYGPMDDGDWLALEHYSEALANRNGQAWVITGPVYHHNQFVNFIGEFDEGEVRVGIPHALFKILAIETGDAIEAVGFVMDQPTLKEIAIARLFNRRVASTFHFQECTEQQRGFLAGVGSRRDLGAFARPISEIERMTGLDFFTDLGGKTLDDRFTDLTFDDRAPNLAFNTGGEDLEPNWIFDADFFSDSCGPR